MDPSVELTDDMRLELEAGPGGREGQNRQEKGAKKRTAHEPHRGAATVSKYAEMCFKEGFVEEGLKGLRRRGRLRKLWRQRRRE